MPMIDLKLDEDGLWPDLADLPPDRIINLMEEHNTIGMACLPYITAERKPAVMIRLDLPDGRVLVTVTTLALLATCVDAMIARHGDPRGLTGNGPRRG